MMIRTFDLLISASLRDFGYVVATAGTTVEALELAKQFKFDLCILDVRLQDGSGIELCQEIHQLQPKVSVLYYFRLRQRRGTRRPLSRSAAMPISRNRSRLKSWKKRWPDC